MVLLYLFLFLTYILEIVLIIICADFHNVINMLIIPTNIDL